MPIAVTCGQCREQVRAKDEHAGRKGKCPKCGGAIEIPALPPAAAQPASRSPAAAPEPAVAPPASKSREELRAEILAALSGQVEPVRVSWAYHLGILLVALVMVLLPLVYVVLIALAGYGMYYHAVHHTGILTVVRGGRAKAVALIVYLAPLVAGAILIFFMFKPLLARSAKVDRRRSLSREGEPLLFAFVERICALVGAPVPRRIDVDCEVNASASFRRGWLSLLMPADLVLTIGMPLVGGLSLRQFAGVLAHEFGHFAQGAGMRLTYVIRSIVFWLTRVVYERDAWDVRLEHWAENSDWRIGIVLHLARLCVWLTRRILWVLMVVGHGVAGFMLRQMELDADRFEARLAGSETYETTCRRLALLGVATNGAYADLDDFYREGRLGDNLPKLILANVVQIPADVRGKLNRMIDQSATGWFDTHPADSARIANARCENSPGMFHYEAPAAVLFADFDALARNVTWDYYRGIFGASASPRPSDLCPVDELLARQGRDMASGKAANRFFQAARFVLRPLPIASSHLAAPADPKKSAQRIRQARERMLAARPGYAEAFKAFDEADTKVMEAEQATALLTAGFQLAPKAFGRAVPNAAAARSIGAEALAKQRQVEPRLADFEQAAAERLIAALELLHVPEVAAKLENADASRKQSARLLSALALLNRHLPAMLEVRNLRAALGVLLEHLEGREQEERLIAAITDYAGRLAAVMAEMARGRGLAMVAYPFDHAKGDVTIGAYLIPDVPTQSDLSTAVHAGEGLLNRWPALVLRVLSNLAALAEQVETACGLQPLPEPSPKPDEPQTA